MIEEELFHRALEKPTLVEQMAFLDEVCGGQPELRQRVERLLRSHRHEDSFLQPGVTACEPIIEQSGTVLGHYKLLEDIGEGGMGTVWMAQQSEPVNRLVAIKLIKPGMDSRQVIARFEAERQALALMDHPNIAKVHDAGTTPDGRPYFVMELVKGVPITRYCDEGRLTPRQRLELFVPVCQAIQHAHQKGIIHRDLKPSNVLVALYDDRPVPKVIDFGVAKATGQQLTEQTLHTGFGAVVGTVEYMSPEQAGFNQLDVDSRSDIYSLGVLLYELLTGSPPFTRKELERAGMLEMLRLIREQEPSKPSTKLSTAEGLPTLAANRGTEPKKLTKLIRGELDWIVMKALDKDRNRRYETANGFAMDVQRYLADEPVQACPPSAWYQLGKFARRRKVGLAIAGLILVLLSVVGGGAGWMVRDRSVRRTALEQAVVRALDEADNASLLDRWPEASAAIQRAEELEAGGECSEELRVQVRRWRADLDLATHLQRAFIQLFEEVRLNHLDTVYSEYENALRRYGIDSDSATAEEAAKRIAERPPQIRLVVIAALNDWFLWEVRLSGRKGYTSARDRDRRVWLSELVGAVDPDTWRSRLRGALMRQDLNTFLELARSPELSTQPASTQELLGLRLSLAEDVASRDLGFSVLRRAQQWYADNFRIAFLLGVRLESLTPPQHEEAARFFAIARRFTPRMPKHEPHSA
jgi:serine/threonine protein kinase